MAAVRSLHEVRGARGDAVALLRSLLADIESGAEPVPERIVVVVYRRGDARDEFYVNVKTSLGNAADVFGLLEVGKMHLWASAVDVGR